MFAKCCSPPARSLCSSPCGRYARSLSWFTARLTRPLGLTSLRSASLRASCLGAGFARFGGLRSIPPLPCLLVTPVRFLTGSHPQPSRSPLSAPRSYVALVGRSGDMLPPLPGSEQVFTLLLPSVALRVPKTRFLIDLLNFLNGRVPEWSKIFIFAEI